MTAPFRPLQLAALASLVVCWLITSPWNLTDGQQTHEEHALDQDYPEVCEQGYAGAVSRPVGD